MDSFNWRDIPLSKTRERDNFDKIVAGKAPGYEPADFNAIKNMDPCKKGKPCFNKYQSYVGSENALNDTDDFLGKMGFFKENLQEAKEKSYENFESIPSYHKPGDDIWLKMRMWQNGDRGFNAAAASDEKLKKALGICKEIEFPMGVLAIYGELKNRGYFED